MPLYSMDMDQQERDSEVGDDSPPVVSEVQDEPKNSRSLGGDMNLRKEDAKRDYFSNSNGLNGHGSESERKTRELKTTNGHTNGFSYNDLNGNHSGDSQNGNGFVIPNLNNSDPNVLASLNAMNALAAMNGSVNPLHNLAIMATFNQLASLNGLGEASTSNGYHNLLNANNGVNGGPVVNGINGHGDKMIEKRDVKMPSPQDFAAFPGLASKLLEHVTKTSHLSNSMSQSESPEENSEEHDESKVRRFTSTPLLPNLPSTNNDMQEDDMSEGEGESGREPEDDSGDDLQRANHLGNHGDVLNKLKMAVQDIKVGEEYENSRHINFPPFNKNLNLPDGFQLPAPFPFSHPATPFLPPIPQPQHNAASSGSSHSSEGSVSSQHNWSFEEQFKQLYEINDDPRRKEFLDDLFSFMQKRGTPINRLPIMAKSVLDLYELYNLVIARGGLVDVINKKLWQEIIKGLHLPSSITSAAFTLRTQYMKYLYPYECEKRHLSTPAELQAAIDGNRREGRRSSYGQYDGVSRDSAAQINSLSLASQQQIARMHSMMNSNLVLHNGAHHPSHPQPLGQPMNGNPMPAVVPTDLEARMAEYIKMINKEMLASSQRAAAQTDNSPAHSPVVHPAADRMNFWNLYSHGQPCPEPQREALNLADSQASAATKREPQDSLPSPPAKKPAVVKEEPSEPSSIPQQQATSMKITSRGDPRTGEMSLVVTMDLNGVSYSGVLFAQNPTTNGNRS